MQDIARRGQFNSKVYFEAVLTLANRVGRDLAAHVDWQASYSGCDVEIYLRGFSYEQKPAYGNDRSDEELRVAMKGLPDLAPQHGAANIDRQGL